MAGLSPWIVVGFFLLGVLLGAALLVLAATLWVADREEERP